MIIGISGRIGSGKDTVGNIIRYLTSVYLKGIKRGDERFYSLEQFNAQSTTTNISPFHIKKFADKLKDIVCLLIGCTREQLEDQEFKNTELGEEWWVYKVQSQKVKNDMFFLLDYLSKPDLSNYYDATLIKTTPRLLLQLLGTEAGRDIIHPNIWVNSLFSQYKPLNSNILKSNSHEDKRLKHGYNNTRIFRIYHNIKQRCYNEKHPRYKDYGKRGIVVDNYWKDSFENFLKWSELNGYSDGLTLDRKDNNLSYSPENCRWVTYSTQAINTKVRKDNTSGFRGVSYDKKNGNRIRANIQINGKIKFLGYFNTLEEASENYELAYIERENLYKELEPVNEVIYPNFIITDMRFPNELEAVKNKGGITIRVNRSCGGQKFEGTQEEWDKLVEKNKQSQHESETALDNAEFDYTIDNNGTIEELIEKVKQILIKEKIIQDERI